MSGALLEAVAEAVQDSAGAKDEAPAYKGRVQNAFKQVHSVFWRWCEARVPRVVRHGGRGCAHDARARSRGHKALNFPDAKAGEVQAVKGERRANALKRAAGGAAASGGGDASAVPKKRSVTDAGAAAAPSHAAPPLQQPTLPPPPPAPPPTQQPGAGHAAPLPLPHPPSASPEEAFIASLSMADPAGVLGRMGAKNIMLSHLVDATRPGMADGPRQEWWRDMFAELGVDDVGERMAMRSALARMQQ